MKTRIFNWLTLTAVVAVLASCSREEMEVVTPVTPETPAAPSGQVYHFELIDGETKATLGEDGVYWEAGDHVGLFLGQYHNEAAVNVEASPKTVSFSTPEPVAAGTYGYAYYPYGALNTSATQARVVFPSQQKGSALSAMPMAGVPFRLADGASNGQIHFLNLGAIINFRIYSAHHAGEKVSSIRFTANSGSHPVSGEATLDLTGVVPGDEESLGLTWSGSANASSVTLKQVFSVASTKDDAIAAGSHYMIVAPGTYSGTITVTTNAATYTFNFTDRELERNVVKNYNMNLDNATREAQYVKVHSQDELVNNGEYIIVYESGSVAFKPVLNGKSLLASSENCVPVTIANERIWATDDLDVCKVVLETSNSKFYMKAVGASGYYFYPTRSGYTYQISATSSKLSATACEISISSKTIHGTNSYFKYSTGSKYFAGSNSSTGTVDFYRLIDQSNTQQLQFSTSSFSYCLEGNTPPVALTEVPVLSGDMTFVTYSSSNASVATVDAVSGTVTVQGLGTTVITATAEASADYPSATASYTLTVWPVPTYSIENDKVAAYLDYVEAHPYSATDYSQSWVTQFSSGTGENNRLDWPKPVPVSWETAITGTPTVHVYNDASHTNQELMANVEKTSSTSANIYSLIPGKEYWYVVKNGDTEVASGHFATTGRRRMIKVGDSHYGQNHANNCRDFGGLLTVDDRKVKFGRIFRGSNMDDTPKNNDEYKEKAYLLNSMKIGLDVDLRETTGSNPLGVTVSDQTYNSITNLEDNSRMSITIGDILDAIAAGKNVYIHCKVGADRTGYVCMLLEAILGVRQDLCDTDYEMTSFSGAVGTRKRNDTSQTYYYYPRGIDFIYGKAGDTFQEKAINYVTDTTNGLGISLDRVTAFQNAMLE